jgi:hypothetical protein
VALRKADESLVFSDKTRDSFFKPAILRSKTSTVLQFPLPVLISPLSLSFFPVVPTLEHRASAKRFVSLQFLNPTTVGRTPWMKAATYTNTE